MKIDKTQINTKVYDNAFTYTDLNGTEVEVKYRDYISLQEMGSCIHNIVNTVVDDEFGYFPYLYDISFSSNLLEYFTDFDTNIGTEKLVEILNKTNLQDELDKCISAYQYETILTSVSEMIEFKKQQLVNKSEIDSIIVPAVKSLLDKVNAFVDVLGGIDAKTLESAMGNLAKMQDVNESNVIQALIKQNGVKTKNTGNGKKNGKNNVVELQLPLQQVMDGSEIPE